MGMLLMALLDPMFINNHPFTDKNDEEFLKEFENASTQEEKDELLKANASDY